MGHPVDMLHHTSQYFQCSLLNNTFTCMGQRFMDNLKERMSASYMIPDSFYGHPVASTNLVILMSLASKDIFCVSSRVVTLGSQTRNNSQILLPKTDLM